MRVFLIGFLLLSVCVVSDTTAAGGSSNEQSSLKYEEGNSVDKHSSQNMPLKSTLSFGVFKANATQKKLKKELGKIDTEITQNIPTNNLTSNKPILRRRKHRKRRKKQKTGHNLIPQTTERVVNSSEIVLKPKIDQVIRKPSTNYENDIMEYKNITDTKAASTIGFVPVIDSEVTVTKKRISSQTSNRCKAGRNRCAHICKPKGKIKCGCLEGFYLGLDQRSCLDIDECKVSNAGCQEGCTNLIGSYTCTCPTGFTLEDDRRSCRDVNECLLRNGHGLCQDTCENIVGSYKCSCSTLKGTKLGANGHSCDDINECDTSNGGCSHICINTLGRFFCSCPDGMELSSDWKTCQDVNECETEEISSTCANCINTEGAYICLENTEMQNDESSMNPVCAPLFPPALGFVSCTRKSAFQSFTKNGRKRTVNSAGTVCNLICPTGLKLLGEFNLICGVNGEWEGNQTGKCVDGSPPILKCPPSQYIIAKNYQDRVYVKFPSPMTDVNWRYVTAFPTWAKNLEGIFCPGKHDIRFTVRDPRTGLFSSCYFKIIIETDF